MRRMLADNPAHPPYHASVCRGRPWVAIHDFEGFPARGLNEYLTFLAWQDQPPDHCVRAAHDLAHAATWLGFQGLTWAQADQAVWVCISVKVNSEFGNTLTPGSESREHRVR